MQQINQKFRMAIGIWLVLSSVFLLSCKKSFMYSDYTFTAEATSKVTGNIYKNTPIPIELKLQGTDILNEEVEVKFIKSDIQGLLYKEDQVIELSTPFTHIFSTPLSLTFIPEAIGTGILEFEVSFNDEKQNITIPLIVSTAAYDFVILQKKDTLQVGKAIDMQAKIVENTDVTSKYKSRTDANSLKVSAIMTKGNGVLFFNNKLAFINAQTRADIAELEVAPNDLIDMKYSPLSHGENRMDITITDAFSNTVIIPVSFQVDSTDFVATITSAVDSVELNKTLLFDLSAKIPGYKGGLTVTPKLNSGAGRFTVDGKTIATDTPFKLEKAGDYVLSFTPSSAESVSLNLKFLDDYGQTATSDLQCKVVVPKFYLSSNFDPTTSVKYKDHAVFTMSLTDAVPSKYNCIITIEPKEAGNSVLRIDDKLVPLNKVFEYTPEVKNMEFISSICGVVNLKFELTKDNGKSNYIILPVTVNPFNLDFSITNQTPSIPKVNMPVNFDLSISEERYDTTYKLKINRLNGAGTLKHNAKDCEDPKFLESCKNGSYTLEYTPSVAGLHEVEFELTDHWGQKKVTRYSLSTDNAPIIVTPSVTALTTPVETATTFSLTASEAGYQGDFFLSFTGASGEILCGVDNSPLHEGESRKIPNNTPTTITYTPSTVGDHVLQFTVMDIHGQKSYFTINVRSNHLPLTLSAALQGIANQNYINTPVPLNINISGAAPFLIKCDNTDGKVVRNGVTLSAGQAVEVSGSEVWQYTPTSIGTHTLTITATDRYKQEKTAATSLNVTYRPLNVTAKYINSFIFSNSTTPIHISSDRYPIYVTHTNGDFWDWALYENETKATGAITVNSETEIGTRPTLMAAGMFLELVIKDSDGQTKKIKLPTLEFKDGKILTSLTQTTNTTLKNTPVTTTLKTSNDFKDKIFTITLSTNKNGSFNLSNGTNISNSANITYTPFESGSHAIKLTATDTRGMSSTSTWYVTAKNSPISISCSPVFATVGVESELLLKINKDNYFGNFAVTVDKDGNQGNVNLPFNGATGAGNYYFKYTPLSLNNQVINVIVTDPEGGHASIGVPISVKPDPFILEANQVQSNSTYITVPLQLNQATNSDAITYTSLTTTPRNSKTKYTVNTMNLPYTSQNRKLSITYYLQTTNLNPSDGLTSILEVKDKYGHTQSYKIEVTGTYTPAPPATNLPSSTSTFVSVWPL